MFLWNSRTIQAADDEEFVDPEHTSKVIYNFGGKFQILYCMIYMLTNFYTNCRTVQ